MRGVRTVLHTGMIHGHPVRIVTSPLPGPDLPWTVMDDLMSALRMSQQRQQALVREIRQTWGQVMSTTILDDRIVTLMPYWAARGMLNDARGRRRANDCDCAALQLAVLAAIERDRGCVAVIDRRAGEPGPQDEPT